MHIANLVPKTSHIIFLVSGVIDVTTLYDQSVMVF
jgi:hypothetical protein